MTNEDKLQHAIDRIRARLAGEWFSPYGDLESDIAKVLRELDGTAEPDEENEPEDSDDNPFDPESPEGRAVDRGDMNPDGSLLDAALLPVVPAVSVKTMLLGDGRADYFVSIKVGNREVTPHVFREEFKAAYHVALYSWLLNGTDKPDLMAFDEGDWPAQATEFGGWQDMSTAPKDGKHSIFAIKFGPFVYSIQGTWDAYKQKWINAADREGEYLAWMPNTLLPNEFCPWTEEYKNCRVHA